MATSWKVEPGHSVVHVIDADGRTICVVGSGPYWQPYGQQDLDHARLIAAAPELLDALLEVERLRLATNEGSLRIRADRMWEVATAAVAKTRGAT